MIVSTEPLQPPMQPPHRPPSATSSVRYQWTHEIPPVKARRISTLAEDVGSAKISEEKEGRRRRVITGYKGKGLRSKGLEREGGKRRGETFFKEGFKEGFYMLT